MIQFLLFNHLTLSKKSIPLVFVVALLIAGIWGYPTSARQTVQSPTLLVSQSPSKSEKEVKESTRREIEGSGLVELLQFSVGDHILGFQPDGVVVVGSDHMLKTSFVGAKNVTPIPVTRQALANNDSLIQPLDKVTYPHLWNGISLIYEQAMSGLVKSTYLLEPGADIRQIRLSYNVPIQVSSGGELLFNFHVGQMNESAPVAWQEIGQQRVPVEVSFHLLAGHEVGFSVGQYNSDYPLVIDPTLQWNTFIGTSNIDESNGIAIDESGNVYVTGYNTATWGTPVNPYAGGYDVFVAKLNSNGVLQWHTFLGSSNLDSGFDITVDNSGNVYVVGHSFSSWGTPVNLYAGGLDVFVAKLDSNGVLQWHTFLGSSNSDGSRGVVVDGGGNVYITGYSYATWGTPLNSYVGGLDAFVAKLNSSGALQWHTFLGSSSNDSGRDIVVDESSNVYMTGYSDATWGTPLNPHAGSSDILIAKLNSSGALQWHTFLGSSGQDSGYGIAIDGTSNLYVTGYSRAAWGTPINTYTGERDIFTAKLNSSGILQWHTFLGSSSNDYGYGIASNGSGDVYVTGYSNITWGTPINPHMGGYDTLVAKLNSSGVLQWHTFMGSSSNDNSRSLALDEESGNVYVTGLSATTWGTPLNPHAGGQYDVFVAKVGPIADLSIKKTITPTTALPGQTITYTLTFSNSGEITATNVVITDIVPISVTNTYVISNGVAITQTNPGYTWSVQDLTQYQGGLITITGILSNSLTAGVFTNTATITGTMTDRDTTNNQSEVGLTVISPATLGITKAVTTANNPVQRGDAITYTIIIANSGGSDAMGVRITDTLPTYVNGSGLDETVLITASEQITFTINVTLDDDAPYGAIITNTAYYSYTSGSDKDTASFVVAGSPQLVITKTVELSNIPPKPGDPLTYTIVVANNGASEANGVVISDTLPAHIIGADLYQIIDIAAGESLTFTLNVSLDDNIPFGETITNTVSFSHPSGRGQDDNVFSIKEANESYLPIILKN